MKIAITGGAGFIGNVLARLLKAQGHELVLLDLVESKAFPRNSYIVDVTDECALTNSLDGVDVVYHLAAAHRDDVRPVQKYYDVNVGSAKALIAAAQKCNIRSIIFSSTVAVYGLNAGDSKETNTPAPFNDYGRSKLDSEQVFNDWAAENPDNTLVTIRLVATFGPGNRGNIYTLMNQIARGKFIMVGAGSNYKTIAYVENVAGFLLHCLTLGTGSHLYNYADKPDLSMKDFVHTVRHALGQEGMGLKIPYIIGLAGGITFDLAAKLSGKTFPISAVRVRKFCADTVVNADKLKETGFKAPYSLEDGLKKMIVHEFLQNKKAA